MTEPATEMQLEHRLRHTFETVAGTTPIDDEPWSLAPRHARAGSGVARRVAAAAAVALIGAAAVGVWRVTTRPDVAPVAEPPRSRVPLMTAPPPIDPPAPVAPQGEEYPIQRVDPAGGVDPVALPLMMLVDASSMRQWQTADAKLFAFHSIAMQSDEVVEVSCDGQLGPGGTVSTGCGTTLEMSIRQNTGTSWQQTDGQPGRGTWQWSNVPVDTDFVQYRVGDLVLWQRPVDGMAAFPAVSETDDGVVAVAYRADGAVLARVDRATDEAAMRRFDELFPELRDLSRLDGQEWKEASDGVTREFAACLRESGVSVQGADGATPVARPAAGRSIEPSWQSCLAAAQGWLDGFVASHS